MTTAKKHIAISITEGRTIRDLFYNGLLDYLREAGFDLTVFTEAVDVPAFTQEWPDVEFVYLKPYELNRGQKRAFSVRRSLIRRRALRPLLKRWLRFEEQRFHPPHPRYAEVLRERGTSLLLATHAHLAREMQVISTAHSLGIPTLGIVRSWDNVYKGIRARPQHLAVWNEVNRQEVLDFEGYAPDHVHIVGSPQFDPYFAEDAIWPREKFFEHFELDPMRPVILFATKGYFIAGNDETVWMDALVEALNAGQIDGQPQVICRLHPWSRYEHFEKYAAHPDVRLSYVNRYWPALTWYMTRDDVVEMANMMHHSALTITPGSTVTLEAAIFDRTTIVPIFHTYQPERMADYFATWVLGKHYGRLAKNDLVPIVRMVEDYAPAINRALAEPAWYRDQRAQLVRDYVHYTDGQSTKRLAELAVKLARQ